MEHMIAVGATIVSREQVQARWGSEGKLYGATVTKVNSDGTVKLEWEAKSNTGKTLVTSKLHNHACAPPRAHGC